MNEYIFHRPDLDAPIFSRIDANSLTVSHAGLKEVFNFKTAEQNYIELEKDSSIGIDFTFAAIEALFLTYKIDIVSFARIMSDDTYFNQITRQQFTALSGIWTRNQDKEHGLTHWVKTGEVIHPIRENPAAGTILYSRYARTNERTISFRVADIERDIDVFHEWHNKSRVSKFWELAKPKEELREYLKNGLNDPHQIPVIVELDQQPVGYFEFYWVKEDRLGPYYESRCFDRGFHFLIGEDSALGFKNTDTILKSVVHFLYLDDARTEIIAAEPRADNTAVLKYVDTFNSWRKVKEFDFPHKRAALLECRRDLFFIGDHPWY